MASLEQMAAAALSGEALALRSLAQDFLRGHPRLVDCQCPASDDPHILAVSAALVELFAERTGQAGPAWAQNIGPVPEPCFLVRSAATMKNLRRLCERESPWPLRRRNLFAPADFLRFA
ncbi:MAG: hypothetical protein HRF43_11870 [Phycisphaerae bacterium]|jgi:hypothetical protein